MSINPLSPLSNSYIQSLISSELSSNNPAGNGNNINTASLSAPQDNNTLSPFAQVLNTLQQLQQTNPAQYQQVTGQISSALESAAQTATSEGNSQAATVLTQLSTDFKNASQSGQLPNIQDLAKAVGGGHHHHHHAAAPSTNTDGDSTSSSSDNSIATPNTASRGGISQLLSSLLSGSNNTQSLDPTSIILNTLSSAGINVNSRSVTSAGK